MARLQHAELGPPATFGRAGLAMGLCGAELAQSIVCAWMYCVAGALGLGTPAATVGMVVRQRIRLLFPGTGWWAQAVDRTCMQLSVYKVAPIHV